MTSSSRKSTVLNLLGGRKRYRLLYLCARTREPAASGVPGCLRVYAAQFCLSCIYKANSELCMIKVKDAPLALAFLAVLCFCAWWSQLLSKTVTLSPTVLSLSSLFLVGFKQACGPHSRINAVRQRM